MKRNIVLVACFVFALGFYVYKSGNKGPKNEIITLSINNKIKSFDPAVVFNDDSLLVMAQSLETLYQYHYLKRPYEVIPLLAEGMPQISDNGLMYRINIRKGIKYHNPDNLLPKGRTVKAEDFVHQIKRLAFKPLKSTGTWLFAGKVVGFDEFSKRVGNDPEKFYTENIEGIRAIDEHTLVIELNKPEPNLLYFLAMQFTSPVPLELIKKTKNDLKDVLVGTGPYIYQPSDGSEYNFTKFKDFHEQFYPTSGDRYANTEKLLKSSKEKLPFIKNVKFKVIKDEVQRWGDFIDGELDILEVPKKYLHKLANPSSETNKKFQDSDVEVKHSSRQTSRWLGFNMNDPIVGKNKNLRKAISYAIDYEKYIEILTNNTNLKANSIFNPSVPGYRPSHRLPYKYDLEKAKEFLAAAGYKPGELTLTYSTRGKQQVHFEEANFLQAQLKALGIQLKINVIEFPEFLRKGRAGKLQFWTDNWIYDYPDAENLLQLLIGKNVPGINKSGFSHPKVNELYDQLAKTLDKYERFKIMYEIEKIVEDELPWIMMMYESTYILQHSNVKNFRKSFFIRNYIKYLQVY